MNQPYSFRLPVEIRNQLETWAASEHRQLSEQILHILADALVARRAECAESGSPAPDLQHRPMPATGHASQAGYAS